MLATFKLSNFKAFLPFPMIFNDSGLYLVTVESVNDKILKHNQAQ